MDKDTGKKSKKSTAEILSDPMFARNLRILIIEHKMKKIWRGIDPVSDLDKIHKSIWNLVKTNPNLFTVLKKEGKTDEQIVSYCLTK